MHFCSKCDNMYYISISETDGNSLIYYCQNCGHKDDLLTSKNICVSHPDTPDTKIYISSSRMLKNSTLRNIY